MNYYEELGISGAASTDEIRHAYRRLVRLFHPDRCPEELRDLAETETKRLNRMLAVLTDPGRRADYDRGLLSRAPSRPSRPRPLRIARWHWPAAAAAAVLLIAIFFPKQAVKTVRPATEQAEAVNRPREAAGPPRMLRLVRRTQAEPPLRGPETAPRANFPALAEAAPAGGLPVSFPAAPQLPEALPAPTIEPTPSSRLAGDWLLAPGGWKERQTGVYPPEYVELRVTETAGVLRGRYRARYAIHDQALSPTVAFQFQGPAAADGAALPWSGTGGAAGQVELHLLPGGALEVNWAADNLGSELGLVSGTATLIRKWE